MPRFPLQAPLDATVLRSGIPDTVPGRSTDVGERGVAAVFAGELLPGETVGVEIALSPNLEPLRTRAVVRYQDRLRCGLEFVAMTAEQRGLIREWAKDLKLDRDIVVPAIPRPDNAPKNEPSGTKVQVSAAATPASKDRKKLLRWASVLLLLILAAAAIFWWRWNRGWQQLETGLKPAPTSVEDKPTVQVPAEVMEKLLIHRVEPEYPPEARKQNLQGIIALEVEVGRDGSVRSMQPLNGPDVLAHAAMDALRWWKFEPYRVNGEPTVVKTTLAVEFK